MKAFCSGAVCEMKQDFPPKNLYRKYWAKHTRMKDRRYKKHPRLRGEDCTDGGARKSAPSWY